MADTPNTQIDIDGDDLFRKYVLDHTNNEPLTDLICRLNTATKEHTVVADDPSLNDDELFAANLYRLIPSMDLVADLCHLRDMIYGDGHPTLDIDPTYQDAVVEHEARPKNSVAMILTPLHMQENMTDDLAAIRERMHDLKFNPLKAINDDRYTMLSELEKLAITPIEPNPYYKRF